MGRITAGGLHCLPCLLPKFVAKAEAMTPPLPPLHALRQALHQHPDLSGQEYATIQRIKAFLQFSPPDQWIEKSHSLAAIYRGESEGPVVVLRADTDALPIHETNTFAYTSQTAGCMHACGHDGHSTILTGVAQQLQHLRPLTGSVVLLWQAEEETGQGAKKILDNREFQALKPDYIFGLHNIPGAPLHQIILRDGCFAASSVGMTVRLHGKTTHAAVPEQGRNPDQALAECIQLIHQIPKQPTIAHHPLQATIVHALLGEIAFGTAAGSAELRATLRTYSDSDMQALKNTCHSQLWEIADKHKLGFECGWTEYFPATINLPEANKIIYEASNALGLTIVKANDPFRWSEDFGWYTQKTKGALFGLGAGKDHPQLHNPDYDFPDELLETGIKLFLRLIQQTNGFSHSE